MQGDSRQWSQILGGAAAEWRAQQDVAEQLRADLIDTVAQAAANGVSEYTIAAAVGVQRVTIRAWLGKGKR